MSAGHDVPGMCLAVSQVDAAGKVKIGNPIDKGDHRVKVRIRSGSRAELLLALHEKKVSRAVVTSNGRLRTTESVVIPELLLGCLTLKLSTPHCGAHSLHEAIWKKSNKDVGSIGR
ncbi:hypothetical protein FOZ62_008984 [Perkinsus olseni]|uniref:Uncharacterized protein n=1 Tax=Perkinsus olseni TaxID=32597 RepID=A0A7J6SZ88_PEROL|nr:hypothetical protein FOZ62_008984 [Perkinsus olseni]